MPAKKPRCSCGECRLCKNREYSRRYRERHPDRVKQADEAYRQRHPDREREAQRRWKEANPDYQAKWRKQNPEKVKKFTARWRAKNQDRVREAKSDYYHRVVKGTRRYDPERERERSRRYRQKYPERNRAYARVHAALQKGTLVKKPCEVCGALDVQAHHEDYSKPLDVRWLCPTHHLRHHAGWS